MMMFFELVQPLIYSTMNQMLIKYSLEVILQLKLLQTFSLIKQMAILCMKTNRRVA